MSYSLSPWVDLLRIIRKRVTPFRKGYSEACEDVIAGALPGRARPIADPLANMCFTPGTHRASAKGVKNMFGRC